MEPRFEHTAAYVSIRSSTFDFPAVRGLPSERSLSSER